MTQEYSLKTDQEHGKRIARKLSGDSEDGVWRTINGSPVFIKEGENAQDALNRKYGYTDRGVPRRTVTGFKIGAPSPDKQKVSDKILIKELDNLSSSGKGKSEHIKHISSRLEIPETAAEEVYKRIWK